MCTSDITDPVPFFRGMDIWDDSDKATVDLVASYLGDNRDPEGPLFCMVYQTELVIPDADDGDPGLSEPVITVVDGYTDEPHYQAEPSVIEQLSISIGYHHMVHGHVAEHLLPLWYSLFGQADHHVILIGVGNNHTNEFHSYGALLVPMKQLTPHLVH